MTWAKRSSQNGIVWMIPLDFVAEQMRLDRVAASAHAYSHDAIGARGG